MRPVITLTTDFGPAAPAVCRGVMLRICPDANVIDVNNFVPRYSIRDGAGTLVFALPHMPMGTHVAVVDPGVGTERKSIVMKSKSGHYFVTPDNGTLTFVAERLGIGAVREIDEAVNRRRNSEKSFTFHGRDVYAYTGARLAAGVIAFEEVGRELPPEVVRIPYERARFEDGVVYGNIQTDDGNYGNIWTNVDRATFAKLGVPLGEPVRIKILKSGEEVLNATVPYVTTFGAVDVGKPLLYLNSLDSVSLAINQESFAAKYGVGSGPEWSIQIRR